MLDHSSVAAEFCLILMWNLGLKKVSHPFSRNRGFYLNPVPKATDLCLGPLDERLQLIHSRVKAFMTCERRVSGTGRAPCLPSAAVDHFISFMPVPTSLPLSFQSFLGAARGCWLFTYMEVSSFSCALPKVRLFCVLSLLRGACHSAIHFTLLPCDLGSLMS